MTTIKDDKKQIAENLIKLLDIVAPYEFGKISREKLNKMLDTKSEANWHYYVKVVTETAISASEFYKKREILHDLIKDSEL